MKEVGPFSFLGQACVYGGGDGRGGAADLRVGCAVRQARRAAERRETETPDSPQHSCWLCCLLPERVGLYRRTVAP